MRTLDVYPEASSVVRRVLGAVGWTYEDVVEESYRASVYRLSHSPNYCNRN